MTQPSPEPQADARKSATIVACTLAGAAAAYAFLPFLFSVPPINLKRSQYIIEALQDPVREPPSLAVIGNSITMNGVDASLLAQEIDGVDEAWNLATGGQSLAESVLIGDELPEPVETVVLNLFTYGLTHERDPPLRDRMVAYRIYGYDPSEAVLTQVARAVPEGVTEPFTDPQWKVTLDSRWICRRGIDEYCRGFLRKDLALEKFRTDLYHPAPFTKQASQESIAAKIRRNYVVRTAEDGRVRPEATKLLRAFADAVAESGQELVVTLVPEHPALREQTEEGYYQAVTGEVRAVFEEYGVPLISMIDHLREEQFVDQIHPNADGTRSYSLALAEELVRLGVGGRSN